MEIKKDFSLKHFNTGKIEASADYFAEAKSTEELLQGVRFAEDKGIPFFILGNGSNTIFVDKYKGLVVRLATENTILQEKDGFFAVQAEAGVFLPTLSKELVDAGAGGLEWAGGVPGTVGGAVRGNAGAFKDFMEDVVESVEALDLKSKEAVTLNKEECAFGYRESIFKKNKNLVVLKVKMVFPKSPKCYDTYCEYSSYRRERHPVEPSFGSTFKNPTWEEGLLPENIEQEKFKALGFIPAGFLVEQCGLSGKKIGGAQISEKHSNFIINTNGATGKDVLELISLVKERVRDSFGIELEEEVEIVG